MRKDFTDYMNDETVAILASELKDCLLAFEKYNDSKDYRVREKIGKADFSFDVSGGKIKSENANTWFSFDLKRDSLIFEFLKSIFDREMTEDEEKAIETFTLSVGKQMVEGFADEIRKVIRTVVLPSSDERAIPLNRMEVLKVEMVDYSAISDIDRRTKQFVKIPGVVVNMRAVTSRITAVRDSDPKITDSEVIYQERLKGNPIFDGIVDIISGEKFAWDAHIAMFVDYSVSKELLDMKEKAAK